MWSGTASSVRVEIPDSRSCSRLPPEARPPSDAPSVLGYQDRISQHRVDPVADASRQLVDHRVAGGLGEGHGQDGAVELEGHALVFAGQRFGQCGRGFRLRREGGHVDRGQLRQLGQSPHHHARQRELPADEQVGQGLVGGDRLVDQRLEVGIGLVAGLHQGLGQARRPLVTGIGGDGGHATTRRTSSSVVSPSMALRSPACRRGTIPWLWARRWMSSTEPPSMIMRSTSSVMGINSARAIRPR